MRCGNFRANVGFGQIFEIKGDTMRLLCLVWARNVRWEIGLSITGHSKVSFEEGPQAAFSALNLGKEKPIFGWLVPSAPAVLS